MRARYPGGAYDDRGPPVEVKRRSKVIEDMVDFERLRDDMCRRDSERLFLRNKLTGECFWRDPDWETVWQQRRDRSSVEGRVEDWQQLYDPLTQRMFEYNAGTGEHRWKAY